MTTGRIRRHYLRPAAIILSILIAFLVSGCLWGVVKDADTGAALPGVTVSYTDANGVTASATTNALGVYAFDQATGPFPAAGPISFQVTAPGYEPLTAARLIEYNENPNATLANLSSFWEVQSFNLVPHLVQRVEVDLLSVDVDQALLAPPTPIVTFYVVTFRVYDPADLTTPVCEQISDATVIVAVDPPPVALNYDCKIPGDDFQATVTVTLVRQWLQFVPLPVPHHEPRNASDVSTAAYDWIAPDPDTSWQNETIVSTDATGPDDPDLEFDAQIRFKSVMAPGP